MIGNVRVWYTAGAGERRTKAKTPALGPKEGKATISKVKVVVSVKEIWVSVKNRARVQIRRNW